MIRILELFAGLGGTTKGFLKALSELGIRYKYVAIEIDEDIVRCRQMRFPYIENVVGDALEWLDLVNDFDFVWASPPCQAYSRANSYARKRLIKDYTLQIVIDKLRTKAKFYIVENVIPTYEIKPHYRYKICRHALWTNIPLSPLKIKCRKTPKKFSWMTIKDWLEFHEINRECIKDIKGDKRQALRNTMDHTLAYQIAKQTLQFILNYEKQTLKNLIIAKQKNITLK